MSDEKPISVEDYDKHFSPLTDTTIVIMSISSLDDWLTTAIKTRMRSLSNTVHDRIFRGYGPLSSFSARIDIGYALSLYDEEIQRDLRALKDIRNAFAHTSTPYFFKSKKVEKNFQKLTGWEKETHPHQLFRNAISKCIDALKVPIHQKALIDALMEYPRESPKSSAENSTQPPTASTSKDRSGRRSARHQHQNPDDIDTNAGDPPRSSPE